ncbi:5-oxoprolinase subunit PxpB [Bacillus niameyensis]|uniref:5-oxoprolinase subunit PxpB n=1 Tax=Bacillus niameyensis TaxID=1522308 RepID=UPI0007853811|nr:5-oxoprolinase subunit PxpB [Bacillus niameyensis]
MEKVTFSPLGLDAIVIDFGETVSVERNLEILNCKAAIEAATIPGFIEALPAYTTLTIFYDPIIVGSNFPYEKIKKSIQAISLSIQTSVIQKKVKEIPVCYEEPFAPDLEFVANHHHISIDEVVNLHSQATYHIYFLGFSPGFPFLGGMDSRIATSRRSSPRLHVPAGSVGIAGGQTGIYPLDSPGGWQIIGRTPLQLFNISKESPTFLLPGEQIRFIPISKDEFQNWEGPAWQSG